MICNTAGQSDQPIEQINVSIDAIAKVLILSELTPENQIIYNDYAGQFMANITACVLNYPSSVDGARFTDVLIDENIVSFDYVLLTALEKAKIDDFITLATSL